MKGRLGFKASALAAGVLTVQMAAQTAEVLLE